MLDLLYLVLTLGILRFWRRCRGPNKFLEPLSRMVQFGVWIDILAEEKFANLCKNFIFVFSFASYFYLVYFIFFLSFFIFL